MNKPKLIKIKGRDIKNNIFPKVILIRTAIKKNKISEKLFSIDMPGSIQKTTKVKQKLFNKFKIIFSPLMIVFLKRTETVYSNKKLVFCQ